MNFIGALGDNKSH